MLLKKNEMEMNDEVRSREIGQWSYFYSLKLLWEIFHLRSSSLLLFKEAGALLTRRKMESHYWAVVHELLKDCPEKCNSRHTGTKSCCLPSLSASRSLDREQAISSLSDKFKLKRKKETNKTNETTNLKECQGLMVMKNCVIGVDYLQFWDVAKFIMNWSWRELKYSKVMTNCKSRQSLDYVFMNLKDKRRVVLNWLVCM